MKQSWVYIMTNKRHNVLYTGVTSDLEARVLQHKKGEYPEAFTAKYRCHKLVWYEEFDDITVAIAQEKRIKRWRRSWKEQLITKMNTKWKDLSEGVVRSQGSGMSADRHPGARALRSSGDPRIRDLK